MNFGRITNRYAKALFSLTGNDLVKAKKYLEALKTLGELFETEDGGKVLRSPVMPLALKQDLLNYGLDQSGADQELRGFFKTVAIAGRIPVIPELIAVFASLINEAEGVVEAEVASPVVLPPAEIDTIAAALGALLKKRVIVKPIIDKALLGGFVARVGNYRVDLSLRTKLEGLAQSAAQDTRLNYSI